MAEQQTEYWKFQSVLSTRFPAVNCRSRSATKLLSCTFCTVLFLLIQSALSNDDDDGSENVAKKNEFAVFQT